MAETSAGKIRISGLATPYYIEGAPVIVESGTLFLSRNGMRESVKLTIKNISDRKIFACEVRIYLYNEKNQEYDDPVIYRYNALKVDRDKTFGWKREIYLPDNRVRSFEVTVTTVIFEDYSEWKNEMRFVPISPLETLAAGFGSDDIAKQFTVQYGDDCQYKPTDTADLWYCTCGAVNHISESTCYKCRRKREGFSNVNAKALRRESEARKKSEQLFEEYERKRIERKNEICHKILTFSMIVLPITIVLVLIGMTIPPLVERQEAYMEAGEILKENRFDEAYEAYTALGLYLDAPTKAEYDVPYEKAEYVMECARNSDDTALELIGLTMEDIGSRRLDIFLYEKAQSLYKEMNGYKDSEARIAEISIVFEEYQESIRKEKYQAACGLMDQKSYLQAYEAFSTMGYYEQAAEMASECLYLRAADVLAFCESNNVRNISLWFSNMYGQNSVLSVGESAMLTLGSEKIQELQNIFLADGIETYFASDETPVGIELQPICSAVASEFEKLGEYKDSVACRERALTVGDFTAEFYSLLRNGDLTEALSWLNTNDDDVPERDSVAGWVELYAPWRQYWKLYNGDTTLIPSSIGYGQEKKLNEFSSKVCIIDGRAVLRIEEPNGEYFVELTCDPGKTDFTYIADTNYYYAGLNNSGRFAFMWYLENGKIWSSCEYTT